MTTNKIKKDINTKKNKRKKRKNIFFTLKDKLINTIFKKKQKYNRKEIIFIMIFFSTLGFSISFCCMSIMLGKNYISVVKDLGKLVDTYYTIVDNYYEKIDKKELTDSAIEGMVSSIGDDFTSYTNIEETESFDETIGGNYEGIGCTVSNFEDGSIVVIDVFENSPADLAGIKKNDMIIKVDNINFEGKTSIELSEYIKKNNKGKIILTIVRNDEKQDITVNLGKVEIPYVTSKIIEDKIGYINISLFSSNSYKQFKKNLERLEEKKIEGLIIDVRNNGGGYLTSVTNICNLFLEKGKIIYQLDDSGRRKSKKDNTKEKRDYGIAVIINEYSASASEILASAIKESYKGYIVGTNSFGKGTVQETKKLLDGSMLKYTTQKWFTPLGNFIGDVGVTPTNYVEIAQDYSNNLNQDIDVQIETAIKLLKK